VFDGDPLEYWNVIKCDPPQENRDKGDSTLTTRFHLEIKEFDVSTLKACSGAHFISKLFCLVGHTKNNKRAQTNNAVKQRSVLNFKNKRWLATTCFSVRNSTTRLKGDTFKYCAERVLGKENTDEHCSCSSINTITYHLFTAIAIERKCVGQACVKNNSTVISRI